jgi:hypothetical protein
MSESPGFRVLGPRVQVFRCHASAWLLSQGVYLPLWLVKSASGVLLVLCATHTA